MAHLTIVQAPALPFDMGYGANPITLTGILPTEDKYALRIYIVGQADPIADIRQSPNKVARAIFDVQNILQSKIGPANYNIDALGVDQTRTLHIADGELIEYQISTNTETNGTLDGTWNTSPTVYTVIAGSKQYYQVPFDSNQYRPTVEETPAPGTLVLSLVSNQAQQINPETGQLPIDFQTEITDTYNGWNEATSIYNLNNSPNGTWTLTLSGTAQRTTATSNFPTSPNLVTDFLGQYIDPDISNWPVNPPLNSPFDYSCTWTSIPLTTADVSFVWKSLNEPPAEDSYFLKLGTTAVGYFIPAGTVPCTDETVMTGYGKPLSDNEWTITDAETGDEWIQDGFSSPNGIQVQNVYADDQCTKTFYSKVLRGGQLDPMVQGLEQFQVLQYSGIFLTSSSTIDNIQSNGGGPNITTGQGLLVGGNFQTITMATGPANIKTPILPTTTHYYIVPTVWNQCDVSEAAWSAQRYNIIEEPCNDYPHIQFAWLNSLGFRDQFTFTKKNEKGINTKRNEFLKEAADYNSSNYSVDLQSRGYTTYSQTITETWSASTDYINDNQVALIESMFKSAQVMARFSTGEYANQWVPVRLQSSNFTSKNYRKDRLFQYTVKFTFANNLKSQRG